MVGLSVVMGRAVCLSCIPWATRRVVSMGMRMGRRVETFYIKQVFGSDGLRLHVHAVFGWLLHRVGRSDGSGGLKRVRVDWVVQRQRGTVFLHVDVEHSAVGLDWG